ncbi:AvrD family protein [Paraburkholderia xenovorans]|uniref:AvrD family protein n=1 Tax=Paraburkholderia xenovorans TaxID=36873 RepID=UPI0038BBBA4B
MSLSYFQSIDEILGSSQSRYFGSGFLNTAYAFSDFTGVQQDAEIQFSCQAGVRLPQTWSVKGDSKQKPHLSSIDAVELSIQALKALSDCTVPIEGLRTCSITGMTVVAGRDPVEENLHALALHGRLANQLDGSMVVTLGIANMKIGLTLSKASSYDELLTRSKRHPIVIGELMLNLDELNASGMVSPTRCDESCYWSLSSCFAAALQVGQALLYGHDKIARAESNTLWMRKMAIRVLRRSRR